jgi:hypothetical protein
MQVALYFFFTNFSSVVLNFIFFTSEGVNTAMLPSQLCQIEPLRVSLGTLIFQGISIFPRKKWTNFLWENENPMGN